MLFHEITMLFGICFGMSIAISNQNYKDSLIIDLVPYIIMIMLYTTFLRVYTIHLRRWRKVIIEQIFNKY